MNKKFAVVLVHSFVGDTIMTMNKEDYGLCLCKTEVLFESDSPTEVYDMYVKNYKKDNE